jgi:hypothetical protein
MKQNLPAPVEGAGGIAKLTTGIATVIMAIWFPPAALAGPAFSYLIDRYVERPKKILLDELRSGNVDVLSNPQFTQFIPMGYKYFEAAKEGEYEHNLKILAAFITNELKQDVPDAPNFSRMARRIEGLSKTELKVIALINSTLSTIERSSTSSMQASSQGARPYVSGSALASDPKNKDKLDRFQFQETLAELASRGLLVPDGAVVVGKGEEYYYAAQAFGDLMTRAREPIDAVNNDRS